MDANEREAKRIEIIRAFNQRDVAFRALDAARRAVVEAEQERDRTTDEADKARQKVDALLRDLMDQVGTNRTERQILEGHKIRLIKMVRVATSQFHSKLTAGEVSTCMGLRDAKELVEKFIDDPSMRGL